MSDAICEAGTELRDLRAPTAAPVFPDLTAKRGLRAMTARPVRQAPLEQPALPELRARTDDAETQVLKVRQARPERLALREPKATKAGPGTNLADFAIAHGQPFAWPATIF
jgi:hypothetical protein